MPDKVTLYDIVKKWLPGFQCLPLQWKLKKVEVSEKDIKAIIISKSSRSNVYDKEHKKIGDMQLLSDFEGASQAILNYLSGLGEECVPHR